MNMNQIQAFLGDYYNPSITVLECSEKPWDYWLNEDFERVPDHPKVRVLFYSDAIVVSTVINYGEGVDAFKKPIKSVDFLRGKPALGYIQANINQINMGVTETLSNLVATREFKPPVPKLSTNRKGRRSIKAEQV